jgi:hypothetical protein
LFTLTNNLKLAADSELSVKNGAELLDRLVKDIVSESASSYISQVDYREKAGTENASDKSSDDLPTAFSLARFIPLLEERIHVLNPFVRTFLVAWLTLLDTIPDLELVYYLPDFLGGLFKFLGDPNRDVYVATQGLLERFLNEIKKIAKIKKGIAESRRDRAERTRRAESRAESATLPDSASQDNAIDDSDSNTVPEYQDEVDGDWIPGQDVQVDHTRILDILLKFINVTSSKDEVPALYTEGLSKQKEEEIGIVALRWIDSFFEVSPEDILQFVPRLLSQVLPALSAQSEQVRTTASRVNRSLMDYIVTLQDDARLDRSRAVTAEGSYTEAETPGELEKPLPEPPAQDSEGATALSSHDLDYAAAVNALTLQFLNEHEETRVAALSWLIMLHRKAPKKLLAFNDGTFPALLKTLSDPSEAVVIRDLQLLSQISNNSDDGYFASFMIALLQLFSTDRKLLEIRGNLIIRQLCINLQPERIYRTLADCIEKDEDIEFASIMVQNLNNNLITAPELAELRKRLRNPESRDGQMFFVALFRAWCYNAVATFSLCLLAQSYEQAYHLLQVFADLEMTVNMLIQIDKLVQLLESPVFTCKPNNHSPSSSTNFLDLRLQLLEPDRYPFLYKCLYGLLMLLPQSSAFAALKNRLNSVSAIGLLHVPPTTPASAGQRPSYVQVPSNFTSTAAPSPPPSSASQSGFDFGTSGLVHSRAKSTDKAISSSILGSLTKPSSSSVAGLTSSNLPSSSSTSITSRVARARDEKNDPVKWPELLDKFRNTQDKARRRSELLMRGEAAAGSDSLGGGPATRSLMELDISAGGRTSRNSDGQPMSGAAGGGLPRPGSGFSRPQPFRDPTGTQGGVGTISQQRRAGLAVLNKYDMSMPSQGDQQYSSMGPPTGGSGAPGAALGDAKGHKSRHSLAGSMGKFASNLRSGGSRDRKGDDASGGAGGKKEKR